MDKQTSIPTPHSHSHYMNPLKLLTFLFKSGHNVAAVLSHHLTDLITSSAQSNTNLNGDKRQHINNQRQRGNTQPTAGISSVGYCASKSELQLPSTETLCEPTTIIKNTQFFNWKESAPTVLISHWVHSDTNQNGGRRPEFSTRRRRRTN